MRIGIDAHIILPQHKRYDPRIARYTEQLINNILEADGNEEHTWVLFFDERMKDTAKFKRKNVEIKHFPFIQYRTYLPVVYSHMLISAFLRSARLDVFHSPEGLIPFVYPGKIVTTFHYVPRGESESNLFVRTFMLGARAAFAQLCRRARRIIVSKRSDKKLLVERHKYPEEHIVVMEEEDMERVDWPKRIKELLHVYDEVVTEKTARKKKEKLKKKAVS
ncbi:MAG: glycosyltransferase [Candidatus Andersenbacteria bacterium]